jgi:hypothetical protein
MRHEFANIRRSVEPVDHLVGNVEMHSRALPGDQ